MLSEKEIPAIDLRPGSLPLTNTQRRAYEALQALGGKAGTRAIAQASGLEQYQASSALHGMKDRNFVHARRGNHGGRPLLWSVTNRQPPAGERDPNALTARQMEYLRTIESYQKKHGYAPTVRNIMDILGGKSPNGVVSQLTSLERKGWLVWDEKTARSIRLIRRLPSSEGTTDSITVSARRTPQGLKIDAPEHLSDQQALELARLLQLRVAEGART